MLKNVILAASKSGQLHNGVKIFPSIIKNYIKKDFIVSYVEDNHDNLFKFSQDLYEANRKVYNTINIGGDHSISIATGASSLNKYEDVKFIWIDAHADIHTKESSPSKNYHGMPLSFLTGLDYDARFSFIKNRLPFQNLLYVGLRDIEPFEFNTLRYNHIPSFLSEQVNKDCINVYENISKFIGNSPVHISFDVDSIDPQYISSTGTSVSNGLELQQAIYLLTKLLDNKKVINLDIVEMNLDIDTPNISTSLSSFSDLFPFLIDKPINKIYG